jgi:hypothetical protein
VFANALQKRLLLLVSHGDFFKSPDQTHRRHLGTSAHVHLGTSAPRHLGTSAPRHLGISASRHLGTSAPRVYQN